MKQSKYDINLKRFFYHTNVQGEDVYQSSEDLECRLGRFLATYQEIADTHIGNSLTSRGAVLGTIVEILAPEGYWVYEAGGEIFLMKGQTDIRPVALTS